MNTDIYVSLASAIISQQEKIVGPLAWIEADHIKGLKISEHSISIKGDGKQIVESLVKQYESLFGRASIEVCRDAVKNILPTLDQETIPEILR